MDIGRLDRGEAAAVTLWEAACSAAVQLIRRECISCIMAFLLACCCFFRYKEMNLFYLKRHIGIEARSLYYNCYLLRKSATLPLYFSLSYFL